MTSAPRRIDVHQHLIPPFYRDALAAHGIAEAGGRALPGWSPEGALELMELLGTETAILSVSTPGTGILAEPPRGGPPSPRPRSRPPPRSPPPPPPAGARR
ncbi:hypothetical protein ACFV23_52350, partial [Streptomyces sp. NPDC059627]